MHYLVSSLRDGFDVGFSGKLSSTAGRNRPSALANPKVVNEYIQNELSLPIGCVPKKNSK